MAAGGSCVKDVGVHRGGRYGVEKKQSELRKIDRRRRPEAMSHDRDDRKTSCGQS